MSCFNISFIKHKNLHNCIVAQRLDVVMDTARGQLTITTDSFFLSGKIMSHNFNMITIGMTALTPFRQNYSLHAYAMYITFQSYITWLYEYIGPYIW